MSSFLEYFYCQSSGYFTDHFMRKQGKYFWCILHENRKEIDLNFFEIHFNWHSIEFIIKQKACPKGLQFNQEKQLCLK